MEEARICMLGSGAAASELLKNLVLPNVRHFTIVDDAIVSQYDLSNNFFVSAEDLGSPRCQTVARLLSEMNSECICTAVNRNPAELVFQDLQYFQQFISSSISTFFMSSLSGQILTRHRVQHAIINCQATRGLVLDLSHSIHRRSLVWLDRKRPIASR